MEQIPAREAGGNLLLPFPLLFEPSLLLLLLLSRA